MRTLNALWLLVACAGLAACDTRVNVGATTNASTRYSSVLVTVKEVWVNERATAGPDDGDWLKFPLDPPQTVELVDLDNTAMSDLATNLKVATGTYRQIRLFLVDRVEPLTESARAAGATFNDQVTFVDANGVESTLPLELPDAARGIGVETQLVVPVPKEAVVARLAAVSGSSSTSSGLTSGALLGSTISATTGTGTTVTAPIGTPTVTVPTVPGATVPTVGVPTVTTPTLPPGMIVPGVTTPIVTTPGVTNPGVTTPVVTTPGLTTPVVTPTVTVPGTTTPIPTVPVTTPVVVPTPTPTPTTANSGGSATPSTNVTVTSTVFFDASRDLVPFRFSDRLGFVLNPSLVAFEIDEVGNIQSQLGVASIPVNAGTGLPEVEVTAERVDKDLGRRVEVASAPLRSDGSFTLYPLPMDGNAGDATTYDLVVHGPSVTTVVIRGVPATKGAPGSGSGVALGGIALIASGTFLTNVAADNPVAPRGARIRFYQTLADDAVPFLIDEQPVDPLTGRFTVDAALSAATVIVYGTFDSTLALIAAAPTEGAAHYAVAAFAPLYGNGDLSAATVAPPASTGTAAPFTVPGIPIPSSAGSGTITATVTAPTPGKYDNGALLVTHDGAIVTAAPLTPALASAAPTAVTVADVPATAASPFDRGLYYLEAWAWSSANPEASFTRQPVAGAVDLRAAATASADVTVN